MRLCSSDRLDRDHSAQRTCPCSCSGTSTSFDLAGWQSLDGKPTTSQVPVPELAPLHAHQLSTGGHQSLHLGIALASPPVQLPRWAAPSAHPLRGMSMNAHNAMLQQSRGGRLGSGRRCTLVGFVIASLPIHFSIFHLSFVIIIPLCSAIRLSDALYRILSFCFSFIEFFLFPLPSLFSALSSPSISSHPAPTVGLAFLAKVGQTALDIKRGPVFVIVCH